jgi:hypothetical protein
MTKAVARFTARGAYPIVNQNLFVYFILVVTLT